MESTTDDRADSQSPNQSVQPHQNSEAKQVKFKADGDASTRSQTVPSDMPIITRAQTCPGDITRARTWPFSRRESGTWSEEELTGKSSSVRLWGQAIRKVIKDK